MSDKLRSETDHGRRCVKEDRRDKSRDSQARQPTTMSSDLGSPLPLLTQEQEGVYVILSRFSLNHY